jgi:retinol dehydrogenase-12
VEDFDSIRAFAKRAEKLDRLDVILENAGVVMQGFNWSEKAKMELTTAINVVGTFFLALLMLPILRKSGEKYKTVPHLSITSSEVHGWVCL